MVMKYNWKELKTEYLKGKFKSLKEFAEAKKIPYQTVRENATNWIQLTDKIEEKADEKFIEKASDDLAEVRKEEIGFARAMKQCAKESFYKIIYNRKTKKREIAFLLKPRNIEEYLKLLRTAVDMERLARGEEQVRVKLDIQEMTKEEILEEIKENNKILKDAGLI